MTTTRGTGETEIAMPDIGEKRPPVAGPR